MKGILKFEEELLVSSDFNGDPHSSIFDADSTMVSGGNLVKILTWYDNETGYSARLLDIANLVGTFAAEEIAPRAKAIEAVGFRVENGEAVAPPELDVLFDKIRERGAGLDVEYRWRRPDGSIVRPDLFVPLAEESGLILPMTDLVIAAVVEELGDTLRSDRALHVAVNVAAQDIKTGRIIDVVSRSLAGTDIRTEQLWMEATERGCMDIASARVTLARARELGHSMALDDFGTGYSSLTYLRKLPVHTLKIDQSFVRNMLTDPEDLGIVHGVIELAAAFHREVIAEGVETLAHGTRLRELGCRFGQGYGIARPMPASQLTPWRSQWLTLKPWLSP